MSSDYRDEARTLELLTWALNGEEVQFAALTDDEQAQCMALATLRFITFNRKGTMSYFVFGETTHTRPEWQRLRDRQAQRDRAPGYVADALF